MIDYANFCAKYSQLSSIPSSPERRFRTASPCRRLFNEICAANAPTNQNEAPVSNANLATNPTSANRPITCLDTPDLLNNTSNTGSNSNNSCSTVVNSATSALALSEGIALGYQRRKSISTSNLHHSTISAACMDDLGFLPTSSNNVNSASVQSMSKKLALAQYDENWYNLNAMTSSDPMVVFSHPSSALDVSPVKQSPLFHGNSSKTPTSKQLFQMKPCSITKKPAGHWNRKAPNLTSNKIIQPRPLRRTISELPKPIVKAENGIVHRLPCFDSLKDAIKRIDPATLVDVFDGRFASYYDRLLVVDCRYPYEFAGGHLPGAINVNTPQEIEELLFKQREANKHTVIIFHCEFSSERAPRMALHVRNYDRQLNTANYPDLFYPEMYILEGGYKNFWSQFGERCEPPNAYVPMRNPYFKEELRMHQRAKHAFRSGCHLSQHSFIKTPHPSSAFAVAQSTVKRTRSLQAGEASQYFEDLLSCMNRPDTQISDLFPTHAIPQAQSLSSILPSELDFPSEMDVEEI